MCLGAIGTQTGGSVIRPAAYCGIAGFKPTYDRISRAGVVPVSGHLDHVGFFARGIFDFALLAAPFVSFPLSGLETEARRRGWPFWAACFTTWPTTRCAACFNKPSTACSKPAQNQSNRPSSQPERIAARGDSASSRDHGSRSGRIPPRGLQKNRAAFGPNLASLLDEGLAVSPGEYQAALEHQRHFAASIHPLFEGVDAFITPATPTTAPARLDTTGDPRFNSPWSYAGVPAACTPCGLDAAGMPAGLQLVGPHGGDAALLATAHWCEQQLAFTERPK